MSENSKIYSTYFTEDVIIPLENKSANQTFKDLLLELVAYCPVKSVSETLRPSLIALKNYFYKNIEKDLEQLKEYDSIATNLLEKKRKGKMELIDKIKKI